VIKKISEKNQKKKKFCSYERKSRMKRDGKKIRFADRLHVCFDYPGTARGVRDFVCGHASHVDPKAFRSGRKSFFPLSDASPSPDESNTI